MDFDVLRKNILNFVDRITVTDDSIEVTLKMNFGDVKIDGGKINKSRKNLKEPSDLPLMKRA